MSDEPFTTETPPREGDRVRRAFGRKARRTELGTVRRTPYPGDRWIGITWDSGRLSSGRWTNYLRVVGEAEAREAERQLRSDLTAMLPEAVRPRGAR